jgi:hypothetical protein
MRLYRHERELKLWSSQSLFDDKPSPFRTKGGLGAHAFPTFRWALVSPLPLWERVGERGRMPFETSFDYTCALLDARARVRPLNFSATQMALPQPSPTRGEGEQTRETSGVGVGYAHGIGTHPPPVLVPEGQER